MKKIVCTLIALSLFACSNNNECSAERMHNALNLKLKKKDSIIELENKMIKDFEFYLDMYKAGGESIYIDSASFIEIKLEQNQKIWSDYNKKLEIDYKNLEYKCINSK